MEFEQVTSTKGRIGLMGGMGVEVKGSPFISNMDQVLCQVWGTATRE